MGMDIDEPRRHHKAGGVDGLVAGDLGLCDDGDSAVPDADVGDAIEHRLRVHDPIVVDDKILFCGKCMCRKNQRKKYICRGKIILSRHILLSELSDSQRYFVFLDRRRCITGKRLFSGAYRIGWPGLTPLSTLESFTTIMPLTIT